MPSRRPSLWLGLALAGGFAYPALAFLGLSRLPPGVVAVSGVALIGFRIAASRRSARSRLELGFLGAAGIGLAVLLGFDAELAARAYPIAIGLAVAAAFATSLIRPPSLVERIARIGEPNLSPSGIAYARTVTIVWTLFLVANAGMSAAVAQWGTLAQWVLWNGLISYLLMAALFAGEYCVRRIARRREAVAA